MSSKTTVLTILTAAIALYVYRKQTHDDMKEHVLSALLKAEQKVPPNPQTKVAVTFGGCEDIFVQGLNLLENVGAKPPGQPAHADEIFDLKTLEETFAYFFQYGAASERYIKSKTLFDQLVNTSLTFPDAKTALGGNAPVMAQRFKKEGLKVLLASTKSPGLRKHIDDDIEVIGPKSEHDDIHLILEYAKGEKWGDYSAPRANRFIVHHDRNNPYIRSMEAFSEEVFKFAPHLLVVGGLQMMDNFPFSSGERLDRLQKLQQLLAIVPKETLTHFELASFAEESCFRDVVENVIFHADSLGMNEQELPNLHSILSNSSVTLISDPLPRIATTLDQMRAVYKMLRQRPIDKTQRQVTRIHVHTLAYQAIMTTRGSKWKNTMSATAKASLTANRHVCGSNLIQTERARILMDDSFSTSRQDGNRKPFNAEKPVNCWTEDDLEICLAPNLVCTEVVQTAGGGDNISSAGLVLQI